MGFTSALNIVGIRGDCDFCSSANFYSNGVNRFFIELMFSNTFKSRFFSQDGVGEGSARDEQDEAVEGQERAVPGRRQEGPHLHHGAQASEQQGQERQPGGRGKQVRIPDHSKISVKHNFQ